jgi:16S rRNA (cytosine967-C5)-methyltransferase
VLHADAREVDLTGYDRVLVDAPCSGLGSLRRRPESRWRRQPSDLPPLTRLQRELLAVAFRAVRDGGLVVYATCSPHLVETRVTVTEAMRRADRHVELVDAASVLPDLGTGPALQLWPHRHGMDGMYLVLMHVHDRP